MADKPTIVSCPTCGARVTWNAASTWRPFCSERCKLIDLGEWAEGKRVIPGSDDESTPLADDEENS